MANTENRKRNRPGMLRSLLDGLLAFRRHSPGDEVLRDSMFPHPDDEEAEAEARLRPKRGLLGSMWMRFNLFSALALLLFLSFTFLLYYAFFMLWTPRDLSTVPGYRDGVPGPDIRRLVQEADGQEISFSDADVNRYIARTCRARQSGIFSILAHAEGVAVVFHEGYAEVVVERSLSAALKQTSSVDLSFTREIEHGVPVLKAHFNGGNALTESLPRGGQIGSADVPERCVQLLCYALVSMADCYPDIVDAVREHDYLPVFSEGRVTLVPPTSPSTASIESTR